MSAVAITNSLVSKLKPRDKQFDIRDSRLKGFMIRVQPSGSMTYAVQYARGSRVTLGAVGLLTVVQARQKAMRVLSDFAQGVNPKEKKVKQEITPTLNTFLASEYGPWVKSHNVSGEEAIRSIRRHFSHLLDRPLDQIKAQDIDRWRTRKIESKSMKPNTINRTVTPLRSAIAKAVEWGVIKEHGLAGLKILKYDDTRIRYLEEEEKEKLFYILKRREKQMRQQRTNANVWRKARSYKLFPEIETSEFADHLLPMFILALNTGIRKGELLQLKRSDINLKKGTLFVAKSKNYLSRYVPLNKTASGALQKLLGHKKIDQTMKYAHLAADYIAESVAKLDK